MDKGNNLEFIFWVTVAIIVIGVGVSAFRRRHLKEKSGQSFKKIKSKERFIIDTRSIYDIFRDFKKALSKEGLIKGDDDLYSIKENTKQTFLKEIQRILNSDNSFFEKREKLIKLFNNWRENPEIMKLFENVESVLNSFRAELETKNIEHLPLLLFQSHTTASNAWEAIRKHLNGLMEDGISSAKDVIKVTIEFLEKDTDEELIKERLDEIRKDVEEELNDENFSKQG